MSDSLKPDLCVIGAGPAALEAAAAATALGASVALVLTHEERDSELAAGALIHAGERATDRRLGLRAGFPGPVPAIDFSALMHHVESVALGLAANSAPERFTAMGVTLIRGQGAFTDRRNFVVEGQTIQPRRFILAAARLPVMPDVAGLADLPTLTADTITTLERLPERLLIIGGDAEGLALAQAFRRLGSQVVALVPAGLLPQSDPEMAGTLRRAFAADGVTLRENTVVRSAERKFDGVSLLLATEAGEERLDGSHILLAAGRAPAIETLDLHAAGIAIDGARIVVDDRLRTGNPRIFSIRANLGHEASIAVQNAVLRAGKSTRAIHVTQSVRTRPEISWVGLSEGQARARHGRIEVLRWPFSESRPARAEGATAGFVKVVATAKGEILGVAIAGPRAAELIAPWIVAITRKMTVQEMSEIVMPAFSLSDSARQTSLGFFSRRLSGLSLAIALKFNRWLG